MPIKYNLTKYDMLSTRIKKVPPKKPLNEMSKEERATVIKAVLIACFASGHSWQTFKILKSNTSGAMNTPEIKKEFSEALAGKWKLITSFDIEEVSTANISDSAFSDWLYSNVDKDYHDDYKSAWAELKSEFEEDCDVIERRV
jgi:hypothetical protein